jgi:phosphoribosylformylglycinamidine synthase PurS subunit
MARVVVDVMLKPEILDPQGKAVAQALPRLGFDGIAGVRQGKRFELEVENINYRGRQEKAIRFVCKVVVRCYVLVRGIFPLLFLLDKLPQH